MPSPKLVPLVLSDAERASLEALSRKRTASQSLAGRARVVLACADEGGVAPLTRVAARTGLSRESVRKWRVRFMEGRLDGLGGRAAARGGAEDHRRAGRGPGHPDADGEGPRAGQPLVDPGDGRRDRAVAVVGLADLAGLRPQAARRGDLEAEHRPGVHRQGPRRRRPVHEPARARPGPGRGREVADPGPGPDRPVPADAARRPRPG